MECLPRAEIGACHGEVENGQLQVWTYLDLDIHASFRKNTAPDWIRHRPIAADYAAAELAHDIRVAEAYREAA